MRFAPGARRIAGEEDVGAVRFLAVRRLRPPGDARPGGQRRGLRRVFHRTRSWLRLRSDPARGG